MPSLSKLFGRKPVPVKVDLTEQPAVNVSVPPDSGEASTGQGEVPPVKVQAVTLAAALSEQGQSVPAPAAKGGTSPAGEQAGRGVGEVRGDTGSDSSLKQLMEAFQEDDTKVDATLAALAGSLEVPPAEELAAGLRALTARLRERAS